MWYIGTIWNFKNKGGCYMWSEKGGYIHHKIMVKGTLNWCVCFSFIVFLWCSILEWWSRVELDHTFFFAMHWRNFAISVKFRILKHNTVRNTFKFAAISSKINWNSSIPCFTCVFWMSRREAGLQTASGSTVWERNIDATPRQRDAEGSQEPTSIESNHLGKL